MWTWRPPDVAWAVCAVRKTTDATTAEGNGGRHWTIVSPIPWYQCTPRHTRRRIAPDFPDVRLRPTPKCHRPLSRECALFFHDCDRRGSFERTRSACRRVGFIANRRGRTEI